MGDERRRPAEPKVIVRHHYPDKPDAGALDEAHTLWAAGLLRRYRGTHRRLQSQVAGVDPQ